MREIFQTGGIDSYLRDESGQSGRAEAIAFPATTEEVREAVAAARGRPVVFQGARTGLCGGAVPGGGLVINFTRMTGIRDFSYDPETGTGTVTVDPGVTLEQLRIALERKQIDTGFFDEKALENWAIYREAKEKLMFGPNPSETSATLGGIAATGATGSRRNGEKAGPFLELGLVLPGGEFLRAAPRREGFEALDLIRGCEGIFGAITELKLSLRKKPAEQYGILAYFTGCREIPAFLRAMETSLGDIPGTELLAADFFDVSCAAFAKTAAPLLPELGRYPAFPPDSGAALWMELGGTEEALYNALEAAMLGLEKCGALADKTLAATESRDFERLGRLRHLLTEGFNLRDAGALPALIDIAVPEGEWPEAVTLITAGIGDRIPDFTLTGHTGDGRLSLRLPGAAEETRLLAGELTARFAAAGYRCSREHGVGRIKKDLFYALCPGDAALLAGLKKQADPGGNINPGVLVNLENEG